MVTTQIPLGAAACIQRLNNISLDEVELDQEEEAEAIVASNDFHDDVEKNPTYLAIPERDLPDKRRKLNEGELQRTIDKASENVIVPSTLQDYRRLWTRFNEFCVEHGLVEKQEDMEAYWRSLPPQLPLWITAWIMDKADDMDVFTNQPKSLTLPRVSYDYAQKMRAAVSHKFGRDFKLGTQHWLENPLTPGKYFGNPSLSVVVSQYMISLRRCRTRAGETIRSARAMDSETMRRLWVFNTGYPREEGLKSVSRKRKNRDDTETLLDNGRWAGYKVRQMLQTLYITSMLCLLRYDEALRVMWHQVHFERDPNGVPIVRLELPFRKTDQTGSQTADFVLYPDKDRPWLDPVLAFSTWWKLCVNMGIELKGRVFRARHLYDEVQYDGTHGMSSSGFMTCFRRNMLELGIDPRTYGTHSFRRGGCQHLAMERRWPFRDICQWGGWAEDFDNPGTIFRYLLSSVDSPTLSRKDFMNPARLGTDPCGNCGRSCPCA